MVIFSGGAEISMVLKLSRHETDSYVSIVANGVSNRSGATTPMVNQIWDALNYWVDHGQVGHLELVGWGTRAILRIEEHLRGAVLWIQSAVGLG